MSQDFIIGYVVGCVVQGIVISVWLLWRRRR